jgi:chaperonin cofactor prefoldin
MGAQMERDEVIPQLRQRLSTLDAQFDAEARKRGFDPAQAKNMALPSVLAQLFTERERIEAELAEITNHETEEVDHNAE